MLIIAARDNPEVRRLQDLNGRRFLHQGPGSITGVWSEAFLGEHSIVPSRIDFVSASDSLAERVLEGGAAAGSISLFHMNQLAERVRSRLVVLEQSPPLLGRTYLLNPRLQAQQGTIRDALYAFARSAEGQAYFRQSKQLGYRDVPPEELAAMEPYAEVLRAMMSAWRQSMQQPPGLPGVKGGVHALE